jgi:hypothetical protein
MPDLSALLATGLRNVSVNPMLAGDDISLRAGSNTGVGNQGTANVAQLVGHGGTPATQTGLPRQLHGGGGDNLP